MDYQKIKYFIKAAETLNFSEASRQMYITPQAFGKQIALLEQEMGFPLFERSTRQTKLTPSGQLVYESLLPIVTTLEREYEKMCEIGSKRSKQIQIGVFNALSRKKVVTPIVTSVLAEYPDSDVSIRMCDMHELQDDMRDGKLDLCIVTTHETDPGWDNCNTITLKLCPAVLVVSEYHKWFVQESVSIDDMRQCDFIKMKMHHFKEEDYFVQIPCKNQIAMQNYETVCLTLEQGKCFTIMAAEVDSFLEKGGKTFDMPWNPFNFELAIIYNKSNTHSFLPELCQFIKDTFES